MTRRSLAIAMMAVALGGCGARATPLVESPSMVLAAATKAADGINSYTVKFSASETVPISGKSLGFLGGSSAGTSAVSGTFSGNFTGDVKVVKPDRVAIDATAKLNGISIEFSSLRIGADSYTKDLLSGAWKKSAAGSSTDVLGGGLGSGASLDKLDPATMTDILKYLSVDQTFADTDVDGAHVHHYRVKLDTAKFKDRLSQKGVIGDAKTNQFFSQLVEQSKYTIEVWVGTTDHLLRRVTFNVDATVDLGGLGGLNAGGSSPRPAPTPPPVHVTAHAQLDYSDFNQSIQVTPPPTG
jgi:hypothetical protein